GEAIGIGFARAAVRAERATLALGRSEAHHAVASDDMLANLGADPVRRVRHEPALAVGIETRGGFQETEVALLDDVLHGHAPAAVFARDHENERQARLDEAIAGA